MESTKAVPPPNFGSLARTVNNILRLRRSATGSGGGAGVVPDKDVTLQKLKLSQNLSNYFPVPSETSDFSKAEHNKHQHQKTSSMDKEAMESLIACLFASISAIKAFYAELQVAQAPYNPDCIQSADFAIVSELRHISELKQSFFRNQHHPSLVSDAQTALAAQIQEQRNLIKTYKITTHKLETDLKLKDSDILSLQAQLLESEKQNGALEVKLHPGRSLSALEDLHLSGLNPTHFLTLLRYTFKSIKSFVKLMMKEMESAGWDLDAAAGAIQPVVLRRKIPAHRTFAFESYVCQMMFSDFNLKSFNLPTLEDRTLWDRRQFFDEFCELKAVKLNVSHRLPLAKFYRAKYLALVHPKMELSFFGNLDQRAMVDSGRGSFPDSPFFIEFAEMARRVWLLHCFFFSFDTEFDRSIFQIRRGTRFSEVYMESVAENEADNHGQVRPATVGFTVVPGFRVDRTVIQCKVYLLSSTGSDWGRRS